MKQILLSITFALILYPSLSFSTEICFFNTDILGQDTSVRLNLLEESDDNDLDFIKPKIIQLDIEDGVYSASSVYYDADKIKFNELVEQIDKKYPNSKIKELSTNTGARWRVEENKFVVSLSSDKEEGMLRVVYIKFMKTEKI